MSVKLEKMNDDNESETIKVLVRTLVDDPNKVWYFSDGIDRIYQTTWIIARMSQVLKPYGHRYVVTDNGKVLGAALWIPPGVHISYNQLIKNGLYILPFRVGFSKFLQIIRSIDVAEKIQNELMKGRKHWQLFYIAIDPDHQGHGYGSMLMNNILEIADKDKHPVFLQNFTVENTRFYEKNGFNVARLHEFSPVCQMRNMIREPG